MKIAFKTLGCRVNLYETDALASRFKNAGYELVDFKDEADIYVVNTCTVTNQSDQKCRQTLHQIRSKHHNALIVATGCMVNNHKQQLTDSQLLDYAIDNEHKYALFDIIDGHFKDLKIGPESFEKDLFSYTAASDTFHTRSLIKIHDGCNNFCSYCIIPSVRGRAVSRSDKDIYENIKEVIRYGFKEIVLTGVNMGRYKHENTDFEMLVRNILDIEGDFRLRISSIEPDNFSDSFIELFKNKKLAPHMHICLQSGSDNILQQMHRHYSYEEFALICKRIRNVIPDFNITTDLIVGFPGETEEDFKESMEACKQLSFSHIHTFKYSVRTGTKAATMPNQIPEKTKNERSAAIRQISAENKIAYYKQMIGKRQCILIERVVNGIASGYGENYIPLRLKTKEIKKNTFADVIVKDIINKGDESELWAEMI